MHIRQIHIKNIKSLVDSLSWWRICKLEIPLPYGDRAGECLPQRGARAPANSPGTATPADACRVGPQTWPARPPQCTLAHFSVPEESP